MTPVTRTQAFLLNVRYTFGYLAGACLLSAPLQLVRDWHFIDALLSLLYGGVCVVIFFALVPFTRIDWAGMRLPEYKIFELAVIRNAFILCILGLIVTVPGRIFVEHGSQFLWTVTVLMGFSYFSLKVQTFLIFPEFYRDAIQRKKEGRLFEDIEVEEADGDAQPAAAREGATPSPGNGAPESDGAPPAGDGG